MNEVYKENLQRLLNCFYDAFRFGFAPGLRIRKLSRKLQRVIFVSSLDWLEGDSVAYDGCEGMLGMGSRQSSLLRPCEIIKRIIDIILSILILIVSSPMLFLIALMIKLDSAGPVFYKQSRVGKDGQKITIIKFRSMQADAEKILGDILAKNLDAQREWNENQKLREDPRITRVGKWIRRFSLDEFPQLINVLKGDMSLVGPRPIVEDEVKRYRNYFSIYSAVRPGITGMWQVSGRGLTTYEQRVLYDVYYVQNWSVWLDMYILLCTFWVVLSRDGAY